MAAKFDKQALKKHHFWILLGVFALVALILLIVIPVGVGGVIEDKEKALDTMAKGLDAKKGPKSKGQIDELTYVNDTLGGRRNSLQTEMFTRQQDLVRLPAETKKLDGQWRSQIAKNPSLLTFPPELAILNQLNFGEKIDEPKDKEGPDRKIIRGYDNANPRNYLFTYKQENVYGREYEEMAAILKPTEFVGGWKSILSPVSWSDTVNPQSEEIWLSLEDLCVRREMLYILQDANMSIARFDAKAAATNGKLPFQRSFVSRLWQLDLILDRKDRDYIFKGKLKNISDKRQSIYRLDLNVWVTPDLSESERSRPVRLSISQAALAKDEQMDIPETKVTINQLPTGLFAVEQELNDHFVPIKQIKALVLGKNAGHRMADRPLKAAKFSELKAESATAAPGAGGGGSAGGPPIGMGGNLGATGIGGGGARAGGGGAATSADETPNHISKSRYIEVTDQVRRMPVAFVIVVDQSNINDVLVALSNSPRMRFQTTQTHLQRVYTIATAGADDGKSGGSGGEVQQAGLVEMTVYGVANVYERPKDWGSSTPPATTTVPTTPAPPKPTVPVAPTGDQPGNKPAEKEPTKPATGKPTEKEPTKPSDKPAQKEPAKPSDKGAEKAPMPSGKPADLPAPKTDPDSKPK